MSTAGAGVKIMKWVRTGDTVQFPEEEDVNELQQLQQPEIEHEQSLQDQAQVQGDQQTGPSVDAEGTIARASDAMEVDQRPGVEDMDIARGADLHAEQAAADLLEQAHEDVQDRQRAEQTGGDPQAAVVQPAGDEEIAALAKEQGSIATDDVEERLQPPIEPEAQEQQAVEEEGETSTTVPSAMQIQVDQQPLN